MTMSRKSAADLLQLVVRLHQAGLTVMIIEQNARRALELTTRAYVLDRGVTRFEDTGANILQNEEVRRLYLGVS
jgi:branched-chain amino acid transport system ATP-binding protein